MALGHYGAPAFVIAGAGLIMLVIHLAVPFALEDHSARANDAGLADQTLSAGDVSDRNSDAEIGGLASTGWILTAAILALIAGMLLVAVGFLPIGVHMARVVGWLGGLLAAMAGLFGITATAHWLGTGFMTLLGAIFQNGHEGVRLWIISPVITFALSGALLVSAFRVMAGVIATRDGLRDQARRDLRHVGFAVLFMVLILVLPWSFQLLSGEDRRGMGLCDPTESCKPTYTFFSAWGTGHDPREIGLGPVVHPELWGGIDVIAERTADFDIELFQGLAFSISIFVTMAWIAFFLGALATVGPLLSSMFEMPKAATWSKFALGPNLLFVLWAGIMFLLAGIYQWRPSWDDQATFGPMLMEDQSWWFAFFPLVAVPLLVVYGMGQIGVLREATKAIGMGEKGPAEAKGRKPVTHSFD